MEPIDMDRVVMLYQVRGVYDGWSVAEYDDGSLHNRWDVSDGRYIPTEKFIRSMKEESL